MFFEATNYTNNSKSEVSNFKFPEDPKLRKTMKTFSQTGPQSQQTIIIMIISPFSWLVWLVKY